MRTIHKYEIPFKTGEIVVDLPKDAKILDINFQNRILFCWVDVSFDETPEFEPVKFYIYGTGWNIPEYSITHLKTLHVDGYVWHVFKEENEE